MSFVDRLKYLTTLALAATFLAVGWITTALAQATGGDGDGPDGDELSILAVVLAVVAIAVVGWFVNIRRSTKAR